MYINESYYNDIIDERNCIKICGYCLCSKELNNVPKQQYHISAKHNKVFDITERKVINSSIQSYAERLKYRASCVCSHPLLLLINFRNFAPILVIKAQTSTKISFKAAHYG